MNIRRYRFEKVDNLKQLVQRASKNHKKNIAFKEIDKSKNIKDYSFSQLSKDVNALGTAMLDMNMKDKHIAIIGENSYLWVVSYLAIINGVGVVVPIDKELSEDGITLQLNKCDADYIIFSKTYTQTIKNIVDKCPNLKAFISMNPQEKEEGFLPLYNLIEQGKKLVHDNNTEYIDTQIDDNKMCEIVFTSGTTGANKGVMLSHKNICTVVNGALSYIKPEKISFSVLPISHTYECNCHILGGILSGITICFNDSLKRVAENLEIFKPNFTVMVPIFLKSMHRKIWKTAKENNLDKHLKYGIWFSNLIRKIGLDFRYLYFKPVVESFGGNLNLIVCGGAPLNPEIEKGLTDLGLDIINGYGITECSPLVSANSKLWRKLGSVGRLIPGCKVKIDNPNKDKIGEVLVKGDNVMLGYYKDEESTKASFNEGGWFKTGDLGKLDRHNFLYINGRAKNLIILSNGKNIHPEELEQLMVKKLPYIKEVMVYSTSSNDGIQEYISASVFLDDDYFDDNKKSSIYTKLNQDIKVFNRNLPSYKRINSVFLRDIEFEKTSTRKIKRHKGIERSVTK